MPKRRDLLERLSDDDPNHGLAKRFYLKAWADSHGLVTDGLSGRVSLADYVEGCVRTFDQAAEVHVEFEDATSIPERCRELDDLAKKFIRLFKKKLTPESKRLGKTAISAAIDELSDRVAEITARSKRRILEGELDRTTVGQKAPSNKHADRRRRAAGRAAAGATGPEGAATNAAEVSGGNSSRGIAEGAEVNPFQRGAKKHPQLRAHWDSRQELWTFHELPVDEHGKLMPGFDSKPADPKAEGLFKESTRIALARLRRSGDPEIRTIASTLREPVHVWLDLMKTKERGFRRVVQMTSWRGGKSQEAFMESGAMPPDARLTENGYIRQVFVESANLWVDLKALGFETESVPTPASGGKGEPASGSPSPQSAGKRMRGRPQTISHEKKTAAALLKASGGTNREAAAVIYDTRYPTAQQTKNVPAILKHHQRKQSGLPVKPRKAFPKHSKDVG